MRHYYSDREFPLVYWQETNEHLDCPVLTIENAAKWTALYLIHLNGRVERIDFPTETPAVGEMPFLDHVPNPLSVKKLADQNAWVLDTAAFEMIIGRWEMEVKGHYSL